VPIGARVKARGVGPDFLVVDLIPTSTGLVAVLERSVSNTIEAQRWYVGSLVVMAMPRA